MTAHSSMSYEYGEPYTEELVDEIVECIEDNALPMFYAATGNVDSLILHVGLLIRQCVSEEYVRGLDVPGGDVTKNLIIEVMKKYKERNAGVDK